jgi:hypothetical protein
MDIDNIPFGADFREHIQNAILQHDLLIAVVGPQWVGAREDGRSRINEDMDLVRIEVETAMKQGIPVVPVLVNGANMPKPSELPESLRDFSFRNAAPIDSGRDFHQHVDRLIRSIDRILNTTSKARLRIWSTVSPTAMSGIALALVLGAVVIGTRGAWFGDLWRPKMAPTPGPALAIKQPPPPLSNARDIETVVDFSQLRIAAQPVAARPYLHQYGISVRDLAPDKSEIILVNNRGLYGGAAVVPTTSENFLTQIETGNVPASYTLVLAEPVDVFTFVRPRLFRDTKSGVTHPSWTATAFDARGQKLSSQSEGLFRSLDQMPGDTSAQTYVLRTPNFDRIVAVKFESDPRLNGVPFAAFSTLLVERMTLIRRRNPAGNAPP